MTLCQKASFWYSISCMEIKPLGLPKKIVLLDDDYVIREVLKKSLSQFQIFTTDNGVEGLGYIYLSNPDLIIVDTTIPKYDGLEVIDYLVSNVSLKKRNIPFIVMHEGDKFPGVGHTNVFFISKQDKNFLSILEKNVSTLIQEKIIITSGVRCYLANKLIHISNFSDRIQRRIESKKSQKTNPLKGQKIERRRLEMSELPASTFFMWLIWILAQIDVSIILTIYTLITGRGTKDENLPQAEEDYKKFRVRYYPTLVTGIVALIFLLLQVTLFISGGVVLFNTKITSIFGL